MLLLILDGYTTYDAVNTLRKSCYPIADVAIEIKIVQAYNSPISLPYSASNLSPRVRLDPAKVGCAIKYLAEKYGSPTELLGATSEISPKSSSLEIARNPATGHGVGGAASPENSVVCGAPRR
ncbi:MAG: hypothetical protein VYE18_08160 [Pseudomonadota bacterium]|nr:hypothetical protein [Pseudomonadota bacterium]